MSMIRVLLPAVIAWAFMVVLPGPNFVMTSQQATARSRKAGILTALGVSTGAAIWATSALLGLGALLAASSGALRIGRLVGGLVLVWFGARLLLASRRGRNSSTTGDKGAGPTELHVALTETTLTETTVTETAATELSTAQAAFRDRSSTAETANTGNSSTDTVGAYRQGVLTSLSNPKAAIFFSSLFIAALPADLAIGQKIILVGAVLSVSMVWYGFVALVMSTAAVRAVYDRATHIIDRIAGTLLVALGLRLVLADTK